jgi:putative membrane protein
MRFLLRLVITAVALWAAVALVNGITFTGSWLSLLIVALIFGLINAVVRPLLKLLTCPLVLLTLGLFIFVINALMLWLTSTLSVSLGLGFHVSGFAAAFWGALVVSIVSVLLSIFVPDEGREEG